MDVVAPSPRNPSFAPVADHIRGHFAELPSKLRYAAKLLNEGCMRVFHPPVISRIVKSVNEESPRNETGEKKAKMVHNGRMVKEQRIPLEERIKIGARIRKTRRALGLSQVQLAEILGLSGDSTVSMYEKGDRVIDHITLRRWCKRDKLTYEWIFDGDPDRLPHGLAVKLTTVADTSIPNPPSSARRAKQKAAK